MAEPIIYRNQKTYFVSPGQPDPKAVLETTADPFGVGEHDKSIRKQASYALSDPSECTKSLPSSLPSSSSRLERQREGSPDKPWIPASLLGYKFIHITRHMSGLLPAVVPGLFEERDSYADTPRQAYHPSYWTGRLVGPNYGPRSEEVH